MEIIKKNIVWVELNYIGVGRGGRGAANNPLWKKIFEIDREITLTIIFFLN
jgi:hypothetical protein